MLGALIENATRHARRQVRIAGTAFAISVEDDGPGMDHAAAVAAMQRGTRLDEAGAGHGLGLAIVRDLAEAIEADFTLGRSDLGGLAAHLRWRDHSPKLR
nr:ATP-binding protein [Sphingomonas sp. G-3-2-10]